MKPRSRTLLDKSLDALLAAIEIYNKPVFSYREESFAILAINAWELLLKARLLQLSSNKIASILEYERRRKADGKLSDKLYRKRNRSENFTTIGLFKAMDHLTNKYGDTISPALRANLDAIVEIRDNAVHFVNKDFIFAKGIHEIGTATVKNYVSAVRKWFGSDLSGRGMFLMPLAFISNVGSAEGISMTKEEGYLARYLEKQKECVGAHDKDFNVALTIEVSLKRSKSGEGAPFAMSSAPDAIPVRVEEADIRDSYPWSYDILTKRLQLRFQDFKVNKKYHTLRKNLESNIKFCRERLLDPGKPDGAKKNFYSSGIIREFDQFYERRKKPLEEFEFSE
jgi:hypothetical protein